MRVLAVDPGATSGMALYEIRCVVAVCEHFRAWYEQEPFAAIGRARLEMMEGLDALVVEEFRITAATARKTRGGSNTAIEIIGALRWIAHKRGVTFVTQSPGDAMTFATDAKLKRLGWYTPGPDHARDAARHVLLYLARTGSIRPERLVESSEERRG